MNAVEKLYAEFNAIESVEKIIKKEIGNGSKAHFELIAKWNDTGRYMSLDEAIHLEAKNRYYGWGK